MRAGAGAWVTTGVWGLLSLPPTPLMVSSPPVLRLSDALVGELVGELYCGAYFPPDSKARAAEVIANVRAQGMGGGWRNPAPPRRTNTGHTAGGFRSNTGVWGGGVGGGTRVDRFEHREDQASCRRPIDGVLCRYITPLPPPECGGPPRPLIPAPCGTCCERPHGWGPGLSYLVPQRVDVPRPATEQTRGK